AQGGYPDGPGGGGAGRPGRTLARSRRARAAGGAALFVPLGGWAGAAPRGGGPTVSGPAPRRSAASVSSPAATRAVVARQTHDVAGGDSPPGFWYGTDSFTMPVTSSGPYTEPVIGGNYGRYGGMAGELGRAAGLARQ